MTTFPPKTPEQWDAWWEGFKERHGIGTIPPPPENAPPPPPDPRDPDNAKEEES